MAFKGDLSKILSVQNLRMLVNYLSLYLNEVLKFGLNCWDFLVNLCENFANLSKKGFGQLNCLCLLKDMCTIKNV